MIGGGGIISLAVAFISIYQFFEWNGSQSTSIKPPQQGQQEVGASSDSNLGKLQGEINSMPDRIDSIQDEPNSPDANATQDSIIVVTEPDELKNSP